jgi:hypothetical protein
MPHRYMVTLGGIRPRVWPCRLVKLHVKHETRQLVWASRGGLAACGASARGEAGELAQLAYNSPNSPQPPLGAGGGGKLANSPNSPNSPQPPLGRHAHANPAGQCNQSVDCATRARAG